MGMVNPLANVVNWLSRMVTVAGLINSLPRSLLQVPQPEVKPIY